MKGKSKLLAKMSQNVYTSVLCIPKFAEKRHPTGQRRVLKGYFSKLNRFLTYCSRILNALS